MHFFKQKKNTYMQCTWSHNCRVSKDEKRLVYPKADEINVNGRYVVI